MHSRTRVLRQINGIKFYVKVERASLRLTSFISLFGERDEKSHRTSPDFIFFSLRRDEKSPLASLHAPLVAPGRNHSFSFPQLSLLFFSQQLSLFSQQSSPQFSQQSSLFSQRPSPLYSQQSSLFSQQQSSPLFPQMSPLFSQQSSP